MAMYQLSKKNDILDSRTVRTLNACSEMFRSRFPDIGAELILFGSQARGSADSESDIDLLVLVEEVMTSQQKKTVHDAIYEISLDDDVVISALIVNKQQWNSPVCRELPLYRNVTREGVRLA